MTQETALEELRGYDHAIVVAERAHWIAGAFKVRLPDYAIGTFQAGIDRVTFGPECHPACVEAGHHLCEPFYGVDAATLAEIIAKELTGFQPFQMGVGSRLRSACKAIAEA